MLRRRPDLTAVLFEPFCFDRRGEVAPGKNGYYETPIFHWHADRLSVFYGNRYYIESAQRFPDVPRLTLQQIEALDLFDALPPWNGRRSSARKTRSIFSPGRTARWCPWQTSRPSEPARSATA